MIGLTNFPESCVVKKELFLAVGYYSGNLVLFHIHPDAQL
jgi:hypothetical protein